MLESIGQILDFSNDDLLLALQQVARDPSAETRRAFYDALTAGTLILLAPRDLAADGDPGDAPEDIPPSDIRGRRCRCSPDRLHR